MQLSITGHHVDITDSLRAYVKEKFERIERHYDHITNVHVVLSIAKVVKRAEATVHTSGAELFADSSSEDMYAAIDALIDKLNRQIVKHKEKSKQRNQRGRS